MTPLAPTLFQQLRSPWTRYFFFLPSLQTNVKNFVCFDQKLPRIDVEADLGDVVLGLIKNREQWLGKVIPIGIPTSFNEVAQAYSDVYGKPCVAILVTGEKAVGWAPPAARQSLSEMFLFYRDFGYYDPSYDLTAAEKLAGRPLTTIKQFYARVKAAEST